ELEKLEYPKPQRDFVYGTFNAFAGRHPWVGEEDIRPKSIAREMFEGFRSFSDYVQEYDLERAEGLLLRHLDSVYKVLVQTVPEAVKTDEIREMELYFRDMLRQVDSSLLEQWEKMRDPALAAETAEGEGRAEAGNLRHTHVEVDSGGASWRVQQMLIDSEGHNDWVAEAEVDLASSRQGGAAVVRLSRLGSLVGER